MDSCRVGAGGEEGESGLVYDFVGEGVEDGGLWWSVVHGIQRVEETYMNEAIDPTE